MIKTVYLNYREKFPIDEFVSEMEKRGFKLTERVQDHSNTKFNDMPKFGGDAKNGLCGPMGGFDDESVCYETWDNYDRGYWN